MLNVMIDAEEGKKFSLTYKDGSAIIIRDGNWVDESIYDNDGYFLFTLVETIIEGERKRKCPNGSILESHEDAVLKITPLS